MTANAFLTASGLCLVASSIFLKGEASSTAHRQPVGLAVYTTVYWMPLCSTRPYFGVCSSCDAAHLSA